jgi:tRNA/rRNA methyltransferase
MIRYLYCRATMEKKRAPKMSAADRFSFVLVRPKSPGNIGSAARALANMGFDDLRLVAPEASPAAREALAMAVHGREVLERARVFASLSQALEGCTLSVGTTCRQGLYRASVRPLRQSAGELLALSATNRIALVFGPEDTGLTNREIKLCQQLVTIQTGPDYPSLNLSQAVLLVAYELMMAMGESAIAPSAALELAPVADVDAMLERMKDALLAIGFLPENNPEHIMFALRAIFGRSGLTAREVDILSGIASQARWAAEGGDETLLSKRRSGRKLK